MTFAWMYLREVREILMQIDNETIERCVDMLVDVRDRHGRVFILGIGGSAANASHMVNDLRKLAQIEAYAPTDNVAELTARINDENWSVVFERWLATSQLKRTDLVIVLSVGGGSSATSANLVAALRFATEVETPIMGIVGRATGYTAQVAAECLVVPIVCNDHVTPHAEEFQSIIWHLFVSHPRLTGSAVHEVIPR